MDFEVAILSGFDAFLTYKEEREKKGSFAGRSVAVGAGGSAVDLPGRQLDEDILCVQSCRY